MTRTERMDLLKQRLDAAVRQCETIRQHLELAGTLCDEDELPHVAQGIECMKEGAKDLHFMLSLTADKHLG